MNMNLITTNNHRKKKKIKHKICFCVVFVCLKIIICEYLNKVHMGWMIVFFKIDLNFFIAINSGGCCPS